MNGRPSGPVRSRQANREASRGVGEERRPRQAAVCHRQHQRDRPAQQAADHATHRDKAVHRGGVDQRLPPAPSLFGGILPGRGGIAGAHRTLPAKARGPAAKPTPTAVRQSTRGEKDIDDAGPTLALAHQGADLKSEGFRDRRIATRKPVATSNAGRQNRSTGRVPGEGPRAMTRRPLTLTIRVPPERFRQIAAL